MFLLYRNQSREWTGLYMMGTLIINGSILNMSYWSNGKNWSDIRWIMFYPGEIFLPISSSSVCQCFSYTTCMFLVFGLHVNAARTILNLGKILYLLQIQNIKKFSRAYAISLKKNVSEYYFKSSKNLTKLSEKYLLRISFLLFLGVWICFVASLFLQNEGLTCCLEQLKLNKKMAARKLFWVVLRRRCFKKSTKFSKLVKEFQKQPPGVLSKKRCS